MLFCSEMFLESSSWQFVRSCEIYLLWKEFNCYSLDMCLTMSFTCSVCLYSKIRSFYLTSVFPLQTGMILGDCIKCSVLKCYSSVASRFPSMFDRALVFSWQLLHLCFEPCFEFWKLSMGDLALPMLNKIWITDLLFQEVGRVAVSCWMKVLSFIYSSLV